MYVLLNLVILLKLLVSHWFLQRLNGTEMAESKVWILRRGLVIQAHSYLGSVWPGITNSMGQTPLETLVVAHLVKKFPVVYRPQRFITVYKKVATGPYPELDESSPHLPTLFP